jgi:succinoglycan biosynthesis transport protein ExoP
MLDEEPMRREMESPSPTVRDLAMVLFRQRRVFVSIAGVVFAAAVLYAFAGVKYEAHIKLLVRRGRADAPVTAQESAPVDLTRMAVTEEELSSEVELLRGDELLRKVVERSGLANHDWLHFLRPGENQAVRVERAMRRLAKKLSIEPIRKTNLIAVSYSSGDPRRSAKVLQSLAHVYLEKHTEVHRPNGESRFFEQRTNASRQQLERAQRNLLRFTSSKGVVSAAQQRDLALQRLSDVDANYRQAQIELAETRRRTQELESQLTTLPERTTTQIRTADNPELLKALKSSLFELELHRIQLLTKFEPSHRFVQEADAQIAQAKAAIAAEAQNPVRDETTDKSANYEWAKAELQRDQVQLRGLEERAAATSAQIVAYRSLARRFGEDAVDQDDMISTEKAAQESYLLYVKKREEARMDDVLDERGIVNVVIAEQPVVPALPVWSAWVVLMVGFAAAGTSGTAAAFAMDYLDPAFRTPDEALTYLNAPILASLPAKTSKRSLSAWRSVS